MKKMPSKILPPKILNNTYLLHVQPAQSNTKQPPVNSVTYSFGVIQQLRFYFTQFNHLPPSSGQMLTFHISPTLCSLDQSCSILNNISVISSKFIDKFAQKCQCYYTFSDQSIPLVTVTSLVSLLTEPFWAHYISFSQ